MLQVCEIFDKKKFWKKMKILTKRRFRQVNKSSTMKFYYEGGKNENVVKKWKFG